MTQYNLEDWNINRGLLSITFLFNIPACYGAIRSWNIGIFFSNFERTLKIFQTDFIYVIITSTLWYYNFLTYLQGGTML